MMKDRITHQHQLAAEKQRADEAWEKVKHWRGLAEEREKEVATVCKQFDDLKTRLHEAEIANEQMRGYISRVQEDDVVREELIAIGDPNGEQRMVPKRKPIHFERPSPYSELERPDRFMGYASERPKPKHWIEY